MKLYIGILTELAINVQTNVNTCNAWGFDGAIKDIYDIGGNYSVHIGTAYFRHLPAQKFINLRFEGAICTEDIKEINEFLEQKAFLRRKSVSIIIP